MLPDLVALRNRFDTSSKLQMNNLSEVTMVNKVQTDYKRSKNLEWQKKGKENNHSQECDENKCLHCGRAHDFT